MGERSESPYFCSCQRKGGRFLFENLPDALTVRLLTPQYEENEAALDYQPGVNKLTSLGYKLGEVKQIAPTTLLYHQQGWGDVSYEIAVNWNSLPGKTGRKVLCDFRRYMVFRKGRSVESHIPIHE